jgi:hypothetical protein
MKLLQLNLMMGSIDQSINRVLRLFLSNTGLCSHLCLGLYECEYYLKVSVMPPNYEQWQSVEALALIFGVSAFETF